MKIIPEPVVFEWDSGNQEKNWKKHKVAVKEAEAAFKNKPKFIFLDQRHSQVEKRYGLYGKTNEGRLLSLVFTIRGNKVRVITVRNMSKKERSAYEKIKANTQI